MAPLAMMPSIIAREGMYRVQIASASSRLRERAHSIISFACAAFAAKAFSHRT